MEQTEKKRDFKVLAEKISPENVLIMSELLAIKETKTLMSTYVTHAFAYGKRVKPPDYKICVLLKIERRERNRRQAQ